MIPQLGNFSLCLALCLAGIQALFPLLGAQLNRPRWMAMARPVAIAQFVFVSAAFIALVYSFVTNDFSVAYVESNSNHTLPLHYRFAATWGGHEGSVLLWVQMLASWTLAVVLFSRQLTPPMIARVLSVLGMISVGFLSFLLFTSNPFDRLVPAATDGRDLNPLLQDIGMVIHPPLLYMGYVGFSVAFAFAIAALIEARFEPIWIRWLRPWTLAAWAFLTLGIGVGSFWAYYELGWGGWWFWDAVENASFMPWLVGTALIHSLVVSEKRGSFKNWTLLLAITTFGLSLLGTFLVRSGVLNSVHSFASDPQRGLFILIFLTLVIGGALSLYAFRAISMSKGNGFSLLSREALLLLNNVMLISAAASVFLGTIYPLALDALNIGKISVGPPYFEIVFVPLMLPVLLLCGVGPFVRWKEMSWQELCSRLLAIVALVFAAGIGISIAVHFTWLVALGFCTSLWIVAATLVQLMQTLSGKGRWQWRQPLAFWGMIVAHLGLGVFVFGVTMEKGLEISKDLSVRLGDKVSMHGADFRFVQVKDVVGPNFVARQGLFVVTCNGRPEAIMNPERRVFTVQEMPMTEAAIDRGLTRDLYLSLGDELEPGRWMIRVQYKPFVTWIWTGCALIALGGFFAAFDRRYRRQSNNSALLAEQP